MKVAVVTGAYKGLGLEWCRQLLQQGYKVVLTARSLEKAVEAVRQIDADAANIFPKAIDVTDESQLATLSRWIEETLGKVDLVVNNAGINPKDYADKTRMAKAFYLDELDADELITVIRTNSIAPLLVVKHLRPLLKKSNSPLVINISSWLGSVTNLSFGGHYGYIGSKNLLNVLNKSMANELKPDNIVCINVNPGWVQTDMGGQKAQFTTQQAVNNIITNVVNTVTLNHTGKFLNFDGSEHPW